MAISIENKGVLGRIFSKSEATTKTTIKQRYSVEELTGMMLTTPPELSEGERIETPAGTWHMEGDISVFDAKSTAEIADITRVSAKDRVKQTLIKVAVTVFQVA